MKYYHFNYFVMVKKASCAENIHFHLKGEKKYNCHCFPSDSVAGQWPSILREYTPFYWLTDRVSALMLLPKTKRGKTVSAQLLSSITSGWFFGNEPSAMLTLKFCKEISGENAC